MVTFRGAQAPRNRSVQDPRGLRRREGSRRPFNRGRISSAPTGGGRQRYVVELGELDLVPTRLRRRASELRDGRVGALIVPILQRRFRRFPVPILTGRLRATANVIFRPASRTITVSMQYYGYYVDQGTNRIRPRRFVAQIFRGSVREIGRELRRLGLGTR